MDIEYRPVRFRRTRKWIAEVWSDLGSIHINGNKERITHDEEIYKEINQWCVDTLGYHARTAYHIFEFRKRSHLDWFLIRWQ